VVARLYRVAEGVAVSVSPNHSLLRVGASKLLRRLWRNRLDIKLLHVLSVECPELLLAADSRTCPYCYRSFSSRRGLLLHLTRSPGCSSTLVHVLRSALTRYLVASKLIEKDGGYYYTRVCRRRFELWPSAYDHVRWCLGWG